MMMQTATPFERGGDRADIRSTELVGDVSDFTLQRRGLRPLTFSGSELCMAMSFIPGNPFWYELNVYRTNMGKFVASVDLYYRDGNGLERKHAWECDSFADVMDSLEQYDAGNDVSVSMLPDDPSLSLGDLAAHAFAMRARVEEARRQFGFLVGELLHDLDGA
ncbi:MAG: hypothetical protein AAF074_07795 [Pseudomonadota bacterium]